MNSAALDLLAMPQAKIWLAVVSASEIPVLS